MELAEIIGFAFALLIGLVLGLLGGGGAILTVPVLTYLFGLTPVVATGYSLFIVGIAASVGTFNHIVRKLVDIKVALLFGVPSVAAVYCVRKVVLPAIPDNVAQFGGWLMTKDAMLMIILGVMVLASAIFMLVGRKPHENAYLRATKMTIKQMLLVMAQGIAIGAITGFVGTGGGFMIVPAMVILCKLPMKVAVGTTLLIATAKSLVGFVGEIQVNPNIDWAFLLSFSAIAVVGIFVGNAISKKASNTSLQRAFAWFVLAIGGFILTKELLLT